MEKIAEGEIKNCRTVQTRSVKKKKERELKNAAPGSHSIPEWVGGATSKIQLFQNSILKFCSWNLCSVNDVSITQPNDVKKDVTTELKWFQCVLHHKYRFIFTKLHIKTTLCPMFHDLCLLVKVFFFFLHVIEIAMDNFKSVVYCWLQITWRKLVK